MLIRSQRRNLTEHLVHCTRDRLIHFHGGRSPSFILAFGTGVEFVRFTSLRPLLGRISESGSPGEREGRRMSSRVGRWSRSRGSVGRGLETNDRGSSGEGTRALKAAETRPRRPEG